MGKADERCKIRNEKDGMEKIVVRGARQHNLKNIDVDIPRDSLVVITGISGSGKSSLAFDTLYAEGQRRYVESLSSYARQFLVRMDRPDVDSIEGLSPAIAIEQKTASRNPRSTVGTITEIYDYLRVLFARVGQPHCLGCGKKIQAMTVQQMVDRILTVPENTRILILSPLAWSRKSKPKHLLGRLRREGFVRVRLDGQVLGLDEPIQLDPDRSTQIEVVVDRLVVRPDAARRITDSMELALRTGEGRARAAFADREDWDFTDQPICYSCNLKMIEPSPQLFSFNSALGACPDCSGLGVSIERQGVCPTCKGARLRQESLAVTIEDLNIYQVSSLDITDLDDWLSRLRFSTQQAPVADRLLVQVRQRLEFLSQVGLSYLSLHRPSTTLSGGEAQRLRLATQIGSRLVGVLYILDEPSIGLHRRDNNRLLETLKTLRDQGNTVLVVEHDAEPPLIPEEDRDADGANAYLNWIWSLKNGAFITLRYDFSYEDTNGDNWDNTAHRFSVNASIPLLPQRINDLRAQAGIQAFLQNFENTHSVFDVKRDDKIYQFYAGLQWQVRRYLTISSNYRYTDANSNIAIYDYDRHILSFGVEYRY